MRRPNAKDLLVGLLFLAFGSAFLLLAQGYPLGSARRMGPAYFPQLLALLLMAIGLLAMLRALAVAPTAIGRVAAKPLLMVTFAVLLFGFTVERWGLAVASVGLVLLASAAGSELRLARAMALAVALAAFCAAVFGLALGLPFPILHFGG
jgi:Tripartite tricarboxylate transporter TctB family